MNIAIFTDSFLPQVNGIVTSVINFSQGLAKKGHRILIIAPKPKNKIKVSLGSNIYVKFVPSFNAYFYEDFRFTVPATFNLIKALKKFKADIIHFQTQFTLGLEAVMCAKLTGLPLAGTYHTYISEPGYLKHVKLDKIETIQKIAWKYSNFFYNKCDVVISPSKATKEVLRKNKVTKKIIVVSNGIDLSKFKNITEGQKKQAMKKYSINNKTAIFIGRVSYEKSIDSLIRAMHIVVKKIPDAKLLIVGDGPLLNVLRKRYSSKNIIFAGKVPNHELVSSGLISSCALFATMSKTENQPMTILEAMASGLPIVGVDKLGVPELIEKNGYVVKADDIKAFADSVIKILEDKNLRDMMSKESLKRAKKSGLENTTIELEKAYIDLISKH